MYKISKEKVKKLSKLKQKKYREIEGQTLVEGSRTIQQLIDDGIEIEELYAGASGVEKHPEIMSAISDERSFLLDENSKKKITVTLVPQDLIALVSTKKKKATRRHFLLYLDRVSDPANLGTIFRTAAAFGIDGIILSQGCCEIFNPKAVRASVGKVFSMPVLYERDYNLEAFKGEVIVSDVAGNIPIYNLQMDPEISRLIVLGSEAHGVGERMKKSATKTVFIPMKSGLESLNVATAATIFMYQLSIPQVS